MQSTDQPAQPANDTRNHVRKIWLRRLTYTFLVLGIFFALYWIFVGRFYESTDDAYVSGNLVEVMPQISGQVTAIYADETDRVVKGEKLVTLDLADAYIGLKNAEANLALTVRQVSQLYQNVDQLQANVEVAENNLQKAKEDYERRLGLQASNNISVEDLRHSKIAYDSAGDSLIKAKHELDSAWDLIGNTDLYHHPEVSLSVVRLRNAYLTWQRTTIAAPESGYVAKRPVQVGQQVTPDTILMIIVPLDQVWVDANFKESQLENFRIGQPAEVISDLYGNDVKYHGKVAGLAPGTGSTFDLLPPQNATGNWIKIVQRVPVRIILDPEQLKQFPLQLGLSVTVTVDTHVRTGNRLEQAPEKKAVYQTKDYESDLQGSNKLIDKILEDNAKDIRLPTK